MASSFKSFIVSCLLVSLLFMSHIQPSFSDETRDLINTICERSNAKEFCLAFFDKHLPYPGANIEALADVTVRQSLLHATETSIFIKKLIGRSPGPLKDIYSICKVCFDAIVGEYVDISFIYKQKNYNGMLNDIGDAERPVNDCLNNLNGSPELTTRATDMRYLNHITHVITLILVGA